MKIFLISSFICVLLLKFGDGSGVDTHSPELYCKDMSPQTSMDMEQIMGMWIGNEVITHLETEEKEINYNSCITIHLSELKDDISTTSEINLRPGDYGYNHGQQQHRNRNNRPDEQLFRYIRLIWSEQGNTLEYTLRFNNTRKGFWYSMGTQRGTMLNLPYNQFIGTVQVIKAVGDHLVLSFCQSFGQKQLFSIILTREPLTLPHEDITSIRGILRRRGLSTAAVRKVCVNKSDKLRYSLTTILTIIIFTYFVRNKNF